jgi:hypothetical protein
MRAVYRYLLCWLWFLPALGTLAIAGVKGPLATTVVVLSGVIGYAGLAWLHPQRQFWHDALCGTRLVSWRPVGPS